MLECIGTGGGSAEPLVGIPLFNSPPTFAGVYRDSGGGGGCGEDRGVGRGSSLAGHELVHLLDLVTNAWVGLSYVLGGRRGI